MLDAMHRTTIINLSANKLTRKDHHEQTDQRIPQNTEPHQSGETTGISGQTHDGYLHGHAGGCRIPQGQRIQNLIALIAHAMRGQLDAISIV